MSHEQARQGFEKWYSGAFSVSEKELLNNRDGNDYRNDQLDAAWGAWQAALSAKHLPLATNAWIVQHEDPKAFCTVAAFKTEEEALQVLSAVTPATLFH